MFADAKQFARRGVSLALVGVGLFTPMLATTVKAQAAGATTARISVTVTANGVSAEELYNFTTDLHNDALWFPNVSETVQTSGPTKPNSKVGTEYDQITFFGDLELRTHAIITADSAGHHLRLQGSGPIATFDSQYLYHPANDGSGTFTLNSSFTAPGITEEALTFLLTQAMQNILTHFNTTGEIEFRVLVVND